MTTVKELKEWLETLPQDLAVGVDEGGLALAVYKPHTYYKDGEIMQHGEMTEACFEVGGIPEEIESSEEPEGDEEVYGCPCGHETPVSAGFPSSCPNCGK